MAITPATNDQMAKLYKVVLHALEVGLTEQQILTIYRSGQKG